VVVLLDERRRIAVHSRDRAGYPEREGVPACVRGCRGRILTVPPQREGERVPRDDARGESQTAGGGVAVRNVVLLDERGRGVRQRLRDTQGVGVTQSVRGSRGRALVQPPERERERVPRGDVRAVCQTAQRGGAVRGVPLLDESRGSRARSWDCV